MCSGYDTIGLKKRDEAAAKVRTEIRAQYALSADPEHVRACQMALQGFGWEDIHNNCEVTSFAAQLLVLGRPVDLKREAAE